jgi:hypothetical protein
MILTVLSGPGPAPTEEEAAAALAAIACLLAEEPQEPPTEPRMSGWRASAAMLAQGLPLSRPATSPRWSTIERLRRAGRGGSGITGL